MATEKKGRDRFDWDTIRREYSTGQFSPMELARRHGCSHTAIGKRVKKELWVRDNSAEVRRIAQARLIQEDAKVAEGLGESCMVSSEVSSDETRETNRKLLSSIDLEQRELELAAETRVAVLRSHRKDLSQLRALEEELVIKMRAAKVTKVFCYKGQIVSRDFEVCDTDKAAAAAQLASCMHKRQMLERLAFNLDDKRSSEDDLPTVIIHDPAYGAYEEGGPEDPNKEEGE